MVTSASDLLLRTIKFCSVLLSSAYSLMCGGLCRKQTCTITYTLLHPRPSVVDRALQQSSIESQLFVHNRDLCLPHLHSTPRLGESPSEYCHDVCYGKTTVWRGYTTVQTIIDISLVLTEFTNVTDEQTDRQTDRHRMRA